MNPITISEKSRSESVPIPFGYTTNKWRNIEGKQEILNQQQNNITNGNDSHQPTDYNDENQFQSTKRHQDLNSSYCAEDAQYLKSRLKVFAENARYFEQQAQPLFNENNMLKDELITTQEMLRVRTRQLGELVMKENLKGESREIVKKIGDLEALIICIKEDYEEFGGSLKQLKADNILLQETTEEQKRLKKQAVIDCQRQMKQMKEECDLRDLEMRTQLESIEQRNQSLRQQMEDQKKSMDELYKIKDDEILALKGKAKQLQDELRRIQYDHEQKLKKVDFMVITMKDKFTKEKKEIYDSFDLEIKKLKDAHFNELSQALKSLSEQQSIFDDEMGIKDKEISQIKEELERIRKQTSEIIHQQETSIDSLTNKRDQLESQISNLGYDFDKLQKKFQQLLSQFNQLTEENKNLKLKLANTEQEYSSYAQKTTNEIQQLQSCILELKEQIKQNEQQFLEKYREQEIKCAEELEAQMQNLTNEREEKIRTLKKEFEELMKRQDQEKSEQLIKMSKKLKESQEEASSTKAKLDKILGEYKEMVSTIQQQLQKEIENRLSEGKNFKEQLAKEIRLKERCIQEEKEKRMKEIQKIEDIMKNTLSEMEKKAQQRDKEWEERLKREQKQLQEKHEHEIDNMRIFYEKQIALFKEDQKLSSKSILDDLARQHSLEIENLKETYLERERKKSADFQFKLQSLTGDFQKRIDGYVQRLDQAHNQILEMESKIEQITLSHLQQLKEKVSEIDQLNENLQNFAQIIKQRENEIEGLKRNIKELKEEIQQQNQQHKQEIQDLTQQKIQLEHQFKKRGDLLKAEYEKQLNVILKEQEDFVEKMKIQFQEMAKIQYMKDKQQAQSLNDLEHKFIQRPSRSDDVQQIQTLINNVQKQQAMIQEAETKIQRANEMVRYYQLEVQNHKNIYDIFGPNKKLMQEPEIEPQSQSAIQNVSTNNNVPKSSRNQQIYLSQNSSEQQNLTQPSEQQVKLPLKALLSGGLTMTNKQSANLEFTTNSKIKNNLNNHNICPPSSKTNGSNSYAITNNSIQINTFQFKCQNEQQSSEQQSRSLSRKKNKRSRTDIANSKVPPSQNNDRYSNDINSQFQQSLTSFPEAGQINSSSSQQQQQQTQQTQLSHQLQQKSVSQTSSYQQQIISPKYQKRKIELKKLNIEQFDGQNIQPKERSRTQNYREYGNVANIRESTRTPSRSSKGDFTTPLSQYLGTNEENSNLKEDLSINNSRDQKIFQNLKQVTNSYGNNTLREGNNSRTGTNNSFQSKNLANYNLNSSDSEREALFSSAGFTNQQVNIPSNLGELMLSTQLFPANNIRKGSKESNRGFPKFQNY